MAVARRVFDLAPGGVLLWGFVGALLGGTGCATSLSTFQPAHVAPKGHVQAEAGLDVSLPTGTIQSTIDAGRTLARAARTRSLTPAEQQQLIDAGLLLALDPPFLVPHVGAAFTPWERIELGLRYTAHAWRLGARVQLRTQATHGYDLTIGFGVQRFVYEVPIDSILDYVRVENFERWNIDLPILFGQRGDWWRLWGGPRLVASTFGTSVIERLPSVGSQSIPPISASADGRGLYIGAQAGAALGWRRLFLGFELTVVRFFGHATLSAGTDETRADHPLNLGTWVIYPGVALMGEF